ncbi:MAG: DNA mismatch repair protein MutT [Tenericutes bacterium HGW-Tenericutes-7]|nr:MAG: DNA mismatch repair protein MutT [Tenericutes bacterium HGW-Tenericutes-7]
MHKYTLGFIKRNNDILMVNRLKSPWKGSWNGLGGKLNQNENPLDCIIREIKEETDIDISMFHIQDKGVLTWNSFDALGNGLHIFLIELPEAYQYQTPKVIDEGILDWKDQSWLCDFENYGVAHNIPYFLPTVINDENRYHYHCTFEGRILKSVTKERI